MTHSPDFKNTLVALAITLLTLPAVQAATMAKTDYSAAKARIGDSYKADKAACAPMKANAKDICVEEAKGKEKLARAELEFSYTGKANDGTKAREAHAHATYAVAKERCDDRSGNDKDVCVKEAKAVHVTALADAKMDKKVGAARTDAAADINNANYKVAAEKCDAMSGNAKASCMVAAKAKYGKT